MLQIIKYRNTYLLISGTLVVLAWVFIAVFGLTLGRDFTGGALWELKATGVEEGFTKGQLEIVFATSGVVDAQVVETAEQSLLARMRPVTQEEYQTLIAAVRAAAPGVEEVRFESVGPVIGQELKHKAVTALMIAMGLIIVYIAWSFRKVSRPVQSWKYGIAAIIALIHDVSILIGVFAVLGKFLHIELDALFVSGVLTLVGFSVHDTIVVFDRIRENLLRRRESSFEDTVNKSINETIGRSVNTSLTALLALASLFFIGGESIRFFSLALMIGIIVGTYSSIFIASPLVVLWNSKKVK